jgi:hypothetical protein
MDEGGTSVEWAFFRKSNSEKSGKINKIWKNNS